MKNESYAHTPSLVATPSAMHLSTRPFNDNVNEMWLAKTVAFSAFGDALCYKEKLDGQK